MRAEEAYLVTREALKETLDYMSRYSLYAFEEEIKQGFITIQGGHRIGIAGKTITDGHGIRSMKFISFYQCTPVPSGEGLCGGSAAVSV